jgi:hypothetical protein
MILTLTKFIDNRYWIINECADNVLLLFPKETASGEGSDDRTISEHPVTCSDVHHVLLRRSFLPGMWLIEVQSHTKHGYTTALTLFFIILFITVMEGIYNYYYYYHYYFLWLCSPARAMASSFTRFLDHTQRRATVGRTPLDE